MKIFFSKVNIIIQRNLRQNIKFEKKMIEMCKGSTRTNKDIFDTVSRIDPDAAAFISYNSMRNVLARVKIKIRPPLPTNACDLDNLLQGYALAKNIYKSYVISEDNKYFYIITSDKLLKILEQITEIFIDGTFFCEYLSFTIL